MADTRNEWRAARRGEQAGGRADGSDARAGGWLDDRGVSEVIGSILVFGLLVSLLAIVQTQAVPDANNEVEVKHNGDVQGDMANLQAAITRSATLGGSESTVVETGLTYPPRLVLFNPPAVQGTLETTDERSATVADFTAIDEDADDYFSNSPSLGTHTIRYRPDYNRYESAPTTVYEYTSLVSQFDDGRTTVQSTGTLVDGNRITLVLTDGGLQETGVRPASVTTYPVSGPAQTVEVETGSSTQGEITLPTRLDEETWVTEILDGQIDDNALPASGDPTKCIDIGVSAGGAATGDGKFVVDCDFDASNDEITLKFQADQSYRLRTAKVGFTAGIEAPPAYITRVDSGTVGTLEVEVRDAFSNPVDQKEMIRVEEVDTSSSPGTVTQSSDLDTNTDGRIRYTPQRSDGVVLFYDESEFTPSQPNAPDCDLEPECVKFDLSSTGQTFASANVQLTGVRTGGATSDRLDIDLENTGQDDVKVTEVRLGGIQQQQPAGLTVSGITGISLVGSTTEFVDGPDAITGIGTGGSTSSLSSNAVENEGPQPLPSAVTLGSGSTETISLAFDEQFDVGGSGESITVTVTVYYSDGTRSTFTQYVHSSSGA